jgi:hypothetical protein
MLPMDFSNTLNAFSSPLPISVVDETYARTNYQDEVTNSDPRTIHGIILALSEQELAFYNQGSVPQAGLAIITQDTLYFVDAKVNSEQKVQSYVTYQGTQFRVVGNGFISNASLLGNANFHVYNAVRYLQ